jgi:GNAT superfamily N-acetyltransferase
MSRRHHRRVMRNLLMKRPAHANLPSHRDFRLARYRGGDSRASLRHARCGREAACRGHRTAALAVYVVRYGKQAVAVGSMFVDGPLAYLAFAATSPAFRRRGAQGALMHKRIDIALALGCTLIATETGTPLHAAEPNPSYQNMLRFGFAPAGIRENYGPPGTQWNRG